MLFVVGKRKILPVVLIYMCMCVDAFMSMYVFYQKDKVKYSK